MATPNIKFFRSNVAPSNPVDGYVWFKTDDRTISLYKNGAWEKYSGIIGAAFENGILTITPAVGDAVTVNLSDMASAGTLDTLSQNFNTLQTNFNTLSGEFETEKGKISTLQGEMTTVKAATATMIGQLAGIENTVVAHVTAEFEKHNTERETIDGDFESRISTLETGHTTLDGKIDGVQSTLQGAIDTEKGRIDTLVGDGDGSVKKIAYNVLAEELLAGPDGAVDNFKTLQELAAWLEQHPEDAATMNSNISTNTTNIATNTADIATIKGNIETINTTIEENELTVASALTDLDARLTSLSSGTVSSVSGEGYISATTTDGAVVVTATTGAVANSDNALAVASDVKAYVDGMMTWGEF